MIKNSTQRDIPQIFKLYKSATDFQKKKFPENQWPEFDKDLIPKEVKENRQFKLLIENKIACIWAIAFRDPQIWGDNGEGSSIYIHRIATDANFRGNNFVKIIVDWAKELAKDQHKQFIRMDTCGENEKLIRHYKKCGFDFLGIRKLEDSSGLPSHYHHADVCFFEIRLNEF